MNTLLRERSGKVDLDGKLIDFLYTLMRDHIPPGTIEKLVREASENGGATNQYSNGWLALYAKDLALRLAGEIK